MTRIFLAALLGGIAMFIWTSLAHMALPLAEAGVGEVPNERAVLDAMQSSIGERSGFYIFPGFGLGPNPTHEAKTEAMKHMGENLATKPSGILVYHPAGSRPLTIARLLAVEFATELVEAFLVLFLLSCTRLASYGARVGFVVLAGVLVALGTNVSYWNWYGFPAVYIASYMLIQFVGFLCIGLVGALVLRPRRAPTIP